MYKRQIKDTDNKNVFCLLYTSDAADDMQCVDLGGRRIIKKISERLTSARTPPIRHSTPSTHSKCFFQAEGGIRDVERSRGLGDVYKRQIKETHGELHLSLIHI